MVFKRAAAGFGWCSGWTGRQWTPAILQMDETEGGAAALAMVAGYYGRFEGLPKMRLLCGVSRDGVKASSLIHAGKQLGMLAKAYQKSASGLREFACPFIVHWEFSRYVVVEGFQGDMVYLNDPKSGHRIASFADFEQHISGLALTFEPGPEFQPGGQYRDWKTAIGERLASSLNPLAFCGLSGLLLVIPGIALPGLTHVFIDHILLDGQERWLGPLLLAMLMMILLEVVLKTLQLRSLRRLYIRLAARMSSQFFEHLLHLPMSFYSHRYSGEISKRNTHNEELAGILSRRLTLMVIDAFMMAFYGLALFFYDWVLTLITVLLTAINFIILRLITTYRVELNLKRSNEYGKTDGLGLAIIQNIETLKASAMESWSFAQWSGQQVNALKARQEFTLTSQFLDSLPLMLTGLTEVLILIVGGYRIMEGLLSIGMLVAFQALARAFLKPVRNMIAFAERVQSIIGDLRRVEDVLENPIDPIYRGEPAAPDTTLADVRLQGRIQLKDISFGYNPLDPPLIENFNLDLAPGKRVALVGSSGSGKSTIARLVCGLYQPWTGEILYDGKTRQEIPRFVLTHSLALVDQEIALFSGTVRDNLTLWDSTIPRETLESACADAAIGDVIANLSGGLDGVLDEGGNNLSGGQRQRMELARALVHNPSILVLDEATSALDVETEAIIDENLRLRGCSCLIVAHRLSTIRDSDEIILMEKGKIIERGDHQTLWSQGGAYRRLLEAGSL